MSTATHGKLDAADRAVNDYFTSTGDLKAQRYDPSPAGTDSGPEEALMAPHRQRERARYDHVRAMLLELDTATYDNLELVYGHGADALMEAMPDMKMGLGSDTTGRLRLQMAPSWGHGSYLQLAVIRVFRVRHPDKHVIHPDGIMGYLRDEANKNTNSTMLEAIRKDCEQIRNTALVVLEPIRKRHDDAMLSACRAKEQAEIARAEQTAEKVAKMPTDKRHECIRLTADQRADYQRWAIRQLAEIADGSS